MLRLSALQRVKNVHDVFLWVIGLWARVTVVISAVAVLLLLAVIHVVLSFTVLRRTREIGVRVAFTVDSGSAGDLTETAEYARDENI